MRAGIRVESAFHAMRSVTGLERARHLPGSEIALLAHDVLEECELAFVDEQSELAGFREIGLRREEAQRRKSLPVLGGLAPCQRRRSDRKQRAAEAIADAVNWNAGYQMVDGIERRHHAVFSVVLQTEITIPGVRVLPRDHKDREALIDELFNERVLRREIENVVLHDPGRHDQKRLRTYPPRRRRVLDKLDQVIAKHDPARCRGDVLADLELLRADGTAVALRPLPVRETIHGSAHEIGAALVNRSIEHNRIGSHEVGRRDHVEQLARGK
jgi:hypothetical protein